jgi:D-alanyl-D-alanine carboxypeptidase/D-alanyl-D-alanine-endopeptidase (penicillin-binding protein 4)
MTMRSRLLFGALITAYAQVCAALPTTSAGALVITQSSWQHQNTDFLANPASIMKLITATVATKVLGSEFTFQTTLTFDPNALRGHTLNAPLYLTLRGDPTFERDDLNQLLVQLKSQGVRTVNDLLVDTSSYVGHQWSLGQVWNDHGICFAAPVSAAIINQNCVLGNIKPSKVNQLAHLHLSANSPLIVDNLVVTLADDQAGECEVLLHANSNNHYQLTGCIGQSQRQLPLAFSVNDPNQFFGDVLEQELTRAGISMVGHIRFQSTSTPIGVTLTHSSKPLNTLIKTMLWESDNLIADSLFKQAGLKAGYGEGSYRSGEKATREVLDNLGIPTAALVLRDGSGLSRENLIYADTLYQVLQRWQRDTELQWLITALPVAGESGTLKYRKSVRYSPLKSAVLGKSGSMTGVINLAGYIKRGQTLEPFVILANHVVMPSGGALKASAELSAQDQFERAFLLLGLQLPERNPN